MDRIIESFIEDFKIDFNYNLSDKSKLFEHFVNYVLISKIYPERSSLDKINVGGNRNPGIDGLAIMVNNHLATSKEEVDYFIQDTDALEVEFNFIQSKTSDSFELGSISTFIASVKEFFGNGELLFEDELLNLRDLKDYIYKNSIKMDKSPSLKLYYATTGKWLNDINLQTIINSGIKDLKQLDIFSDIKFLPIDADKLKSLYREIKNKITKEIIFEKHTILPKMGNITESYLGILPAAELVKITSDDDGELIKTIFYDNVRDFQGFNKVNTGIRNTIIEKKGDDKFVLLNNGITIVAKSLNKVGSAFKLSEFQIVNGCQTSHVLHHIKEQITPDVYIPLKLIVTDHDDTINDIIRATNSQTEVKNEAFEILKPFHKRLEEFYLTFEKDENKKLYYERRSRQYFGIKSKNDKVIGLSNQIASYIAMFLNEPQSTQRYFGELLNSYSNRLFYENHSLYPYYTSSLALNVLEDFFRENKLKQTSKRYKYHLILMFRIRIAGEKIPMNSSSNKQIESYCNKIMEALWDRKKALETFKILETKLEEVLKQTKILHRNAHQTRAFTEELIPTVKTNKKFGKLTYYDFQKGFGFIRVDNTEEDVFVHYTELTKIQQNEIMPGLKLTFDIFQSHKGPQAKNVEKSQ
ncbi:cold shock CspA family protein [Dysgonomonas sp. PH5-45]|uniref:AIPR family protein n=1 Tax=unclassified Dysgonomonas TaxID=2630389 RepID=UPI00247571B6|nr:MULTISPECIES: AIPR family protein [unclassified Dysgonomonas]MDH6354589.1 cold shock CspA family protein [Dysgonomonas sp. PH5-45]MDH6387487.1 cold shock CspA family protein [Dysgonomonas sp. PH5-37]